MSTTPLTRERRRRGPSWVHEVVEVIDGRRRLALGVAGFVSVVGVVTALVAPDLLPATPVVGAAVGVAACLVAVASVVAVDAGDPTVRGDRHVRAAGASLAATVIGSEPSLQLVEWTEQHIRETDGLRLALASAGGSSSRTGDLTDRLGTVLARRGWRVLVVDLSRERSERAGAAEVCRAEFRLSQAVELHPSLNLARLGSGRGFETALHEFPALAARLPRDVDALLVALPNIRRPGVLPAAAAADRALALTEEGATTRVDLIAALDALDEARVPSDVVLLRDEGNARDEPIAVEEEPSAGTGPTDEPVAEPPLFARDDAVRTPPDTTEDAAADTSSDEVTPDEPPRSLAAVPPEAAPTTAVPADAAPQPVDEDEGPFEDPDATAPMAPVDVDDDGLGQPDLEESDELRVAVTLDALVRHSPPDA